MAAHGGSKSNPALQQKGTRNFSSYIHPSAAPCVQLTSKQNNAKWIKKNPKNPYKTSQTKNKWKKDMEEHVTRSMPDALF